MAGTLRTLAKRAWRQVVSDLRADPYLPYVLVLTALLAGFWFWHRTPNFATRDESTRLLDPMVAFGTFLSDPGVESLREGVAWGREPFGATFYLFGLALVPVVLAAAVRGQLDAFLAFHLPRAAFGYWAVWHATPAWIWTWSIALVRLINVAFAVGSVYLTYRIGVQVRDRTAGRLGALFLALTFGFLTLAHEGGEDVPALFFLLLSITLLIAYVRTGEAAPFLAASAFGGVAIAFKLTAAPIVAVVGAAFLLRAHRLGPAWRSALDRPWLLLGGAWLGLLALVLGFPTLLVGEVGIVLERVFLASVARSEHATGPDAPVWWWFARQYFDAFGLPLFLATLAGLAATVARVRDRARDVHATVLVLVSLGLFVAVFSRWHDFRVHHLLPTFPLLVVLLGAALSSLRERRAGLAGVVVALLVVSAGAYAVVGTAGYATAPRDGAVAWLDANADPGDTLEVYRVHMQDAAVPHWMTVAHRWNRDEVVGATCPRYVELGYRDLLYLDPNTYYRNDPAVAAYVRGLLSGQDGYRIVAEFGPRPPNFVPDRPRPGSLADLVRVGIYPETDQYADEQELRENQYTVILERTGECDPSRVPRIER